MSSGTRNLVGILAVSGVLHFVVPKPYTAIVPKPLPYKRELVYASGAVELGCAALLTQPRTRRLGGLLSFGLLLAVFPANVQMAMDGWRSGTTPTWYQVGLLLRLPLQIPPLRWAARAAREDGP
ncbi:MAG: DoxX family protein [Aeromicrobium sp.]